MITKQRLKELIEQGATIWHIVGKNIFNLNASDVPTFYTLSDENWDVWKDDYFETKEEAEWYLEFGNITKPIKLYIPTWEEFKNQEKQIRFFSYPCNYACYTDLVNIGITEYYGMGGKEIFEKPLTKENYLEACEICRKLWLGEEV